MNKSDLIETLSKGEDLTEIQSVMGRVWCKK